MYVEDTDGKQLVLQGYSFTRKIGHLHVVFSDGRDTCRLNGWGRNFFLHNYSLWVADS